VQQPPYFGNLALPADEAGQLQWQVVLLRLRHGRIGRAVLTLLIGRARSGGHKDQTFRNIERQRLGQSDDSARAWRNTAAALERRDGSHAQWRTFSEVSLRKTRGASVLSEQRREGGGRLCACVQECQDLCSLASTRALRGRAYTL
jgi:hypothetical protein